MAKVKFNFSTDPEVLDMLKALAAAENRKPGNYLETLIRYNWSIRPGAKK